MEKRFELPGKVARRASLKERLAPATTSGAKLLPQTICLDIRQGL
jgi:hypothetical protein